MVLFLYRLCIHTQNTHGPGPLAHSPLQSPPAFGNILNQLFVVLHQQLMEPILLPLAVAHRPRRQLQQLGAGLEEPAGVARGLGSFHLVSCQHPDLHASCVQGFNRLCQLLLQPARRKASLHGLGLAASTEPLFCREETPARDKLVDYPLCWRDHCHRNKD